MLKSFDVFTYDLPLERIAQRPIKPYDAAKLLIVNTKHDVIVSSYFYELSNILRPSDVLVFNNTKVLPSRLFGKIEDSSSEVEVFLIAQVSAAKWRCAAKPLRKIKSDSVIRFTPDLIASAGQRINEREIELEFTSDGDLNSDLMKAACMPIPPYIRDGRADSEDLLDYQSIFAELPGSIAAPTASLHFTKELLEKIKSHNVKVEQITLHLGTASFRSLWEDDGVDSELKPPAAEKVVFNSETLQNLLEKKAQGSRIVAVGTSVVRALESMIRIDESLRADMNNHTMDTDLFIAPGFDFKIVDAIITNFHQPRSSHLLLVEAFLGKDLLKNSYKRALDQDYRFLSYGDGMFLC